MDGLESKRDEIEIVLDMWRTDAAYIERRMTDDLAARQEEKTKAKEEVYG